MSTKQLLPLCNIPKIASRDGYVGVTAHILVPFYGFYFFNGDQYTFGGGTAVQDPARTMGGSTKPNTFVKAAGVCI